MAKARLNLPFFGQYGPKIVGKFYVVVLPDEPVDFLEAHKQVAARGKWLDQQCEGGAMVISALKIGFQSLDDAVLFKMQFGGRIKEAE